MTALSCLSYLGDQDVRVWAADDRLGEALEVDLSPHSIFETPTISGLASAIETVHWLARDAGDDAERVSEALEKGEL